MLFRSGYELSYLIPDYYTGDPVKSQRFRFRFCPCFFSGKEENGVDFPPGVWFNVKVKYYEGVATHLCAKYANIPTCRSGMLLIARLM